MTDEHRSAFDKAKAESQEAYQRIEQHRDAQPGSLGPFGKNMRQADEARMLDAYKQILWVQFRYKEDSEVARQVALVESQLADAQIAFEAERDRWREELQRQYMQHRQLTEGFQQNVFAWQREVFGGRFDREAYHNQLNLFEEHARRGVQMYPEDATFKGMVEQVEDLRRKNEY